MELRTDRFKFKELFPDKAKKFAQKLHIKADELDFVRKGIPIDPKDIEIKEGERAAIRLITTPHLDRDSEILIPHGAMLDDFRQSPSVLFGHDYKSLPIGHDQWIKVVKEGIVAKTAYATHQFAEDVFQCVKHKDLNSNSVGFIPLESVKPEDKKQFQVIQDTLEKDYGIDKKESGKAKNIYTKWIMLEHSDVPVASNPQSLNLAVSKGEITIKSKRLIKELEIEVVKDGKSLEEAERELTKAVLKGEAERIDEEFVVEKDDREIEIELGNPEEGGIFAVGEEGVEALNGIKEKLVKQGFFKAEEEIGEIKGGAKHIDFDETERIGILVDGRRFLINSDNKIEEITKPETTEEYHHIPVNPGCKITATITISSDKGIKATYCGGTKKIHTYLFDVEKWTMAEAQAWVKENHKRELEGWIQKTAENEPQRKERWNKSLSKLFDIASAESSAPMRFHYDLYEKFLECKIKEVFQNAYTIPSPLMGSYLAAFKDILDKFDLKDTRRFSYAGDETPPNYEVIQLNSEKTDDFLIDGMQFYEAEKKPLIVNYSPEWYGITVTLTTSTANKQWNKDLLDKVHAWVQKNNFLRGEKFALSGEFLKEPGDNWDNLILKDKYKDAIMMSAKALETKGEKLVGRGLLFIGPPGTGKTKTGRVLMNELDATFIWVSSRDFRHIGPLRALAIGFSMARDLAPSVLFLEDIDTWLRGEMEFVTDSLKTEMDGIKQNRGMITIMTSNYPEKLPPALLDRPGRFHHIVNFELPDEEQRKDMIKLWAGDIDEKLLDKLAEKTDGFSGAHLKELVEFAKMIAEEEEIEIADAMLLSLDKLMEQRELIEEIRANAEDAKEFWGKLKYASISKSIIILERQDALIADLSAVTIETQQSGDDGPKQIQNIINQIRDRVEGPYEKLLQEKDDHIADLKEGRVLSRKNRDVVKAAIKALSDVLKADATGTQEDTDGAGEGTVTEREAEIEIIKDGEKEFSKEDIAKVIKETSGPALVEAVEKALKENLNPEKLKEAMKEIARIELQRIRGRVE